MRHPTLKTKRNRGRMVLAGALGLGLAALPPAAEPAAQGKLTLREPLAIASSGSAISVTQSLARGFTMAYAGTVPPIVRPLGSTRALEMFCSGVGPDTPDLALVTRRMPRTLADACEANGVADVVELQIGRGAVVLAVKRGDPAPALTSRQVWEAIAAERALEEGFAPNRLARWSDIANGLPQGEIRFLVPDANSGTHALFEDFVLEGGCRWVKQIRLLFEASYRRTKCVTMRDDGRVRTVRSDELPSVLLASAPGTIGVVSFEQLHASGGNLIALSLDGMQPTAASIANLDYEHTRLLYLYAKRQHMRSERGVGVVRGIREFLTEATSEAAIGPGGYLASTGLVPLSPVDRAEQRRLAERVAPHGG